MLTIRREQFAAFAKQRREKVRQWRLGVLGEDLQSLGLVDLEDAAHRDLLRRHWIETHGEDAPVAGPEEELASLIRVEAAAADDAGIRDPMLLLDVLGFPFRYGLDWKRDEVVADLLRRRDLSQSTKMEAVYSRLKVLLRLRLRRK